MNWVHQLQILQANLTLYFLHYEITTLHRYKSFYYKKKIYREKNIDKDFYGTIKRTTRKLLQ